MNTTGRITALALAGMLVLPSLSFADGNHGNGRPNPGLALGHDKKKKNGRHDDRRGSANRWNVRHREDRDRDDDRWNDRWSDDHRWNDDRWESDRYRNDDRWSEDRYRGGYRGNEYDRRQETKNEWRNIGIAAGIVGLLGLLNNDSTLTFGGAAGALYSAYRYEQDRKSQNRLDRARAHYFSQPMFYRDGHRFERRTVSRGGQKYYQFVRCD